MPQALQFAFEDAPSVRIGAAARLADWAARERGRFPLFLPVLMASGVVLYFALRVEPPRWAGPSALLAAILLATLGWRRLPARGAALALVAASLGFTAASIATSRALPIVPLPSKAVVLTGTVRTVEILPGGRRLTLAGAVLDPAAPALQRRLHVRLRDDDPATITAGDVIRVRALLRPPAPPAYPGAWDLQRDDYFSGLAGGGYALGPLAVVRRAAPQGIAAWWQGMRNAVAQRLMAGLPGAEGAIAATVLTGTSAAIPPADRGVFRDSGLAHLLAVAGLHIGIVMGLVMALARLLLAVSERASLHWPCKQIAAAAALAAGGFYTALTGMHVPTIRSFAMACLVVVGLLLGRRALSLRGLALAAIVLMLVAPQEVVGVSFQMSFAAVLALIAGYEALRPVLLRLQGDGVLRRTRAHLAMLALTSLLAGTASAPFAAYHFGQVQLYFVAANMAAVPLAAMWVMPAGLIALALMPFHLEQLALVPMGWGIDGLLWIGRQVSSWPAATVAVPHMPAWGLAVLALGLAWLGLWRSRLRLAGIAGIALGLMSPLLARPPDLLVSADARLIAFRTGGEAWLQSRSGARFTEKEWQQFWAIPGFTPLPKTGSAAGGTVACNDTGCRLRARSDGAAVLLVRDPATAAPACDAVLLVAAEPLQRLCPDLPRIDRFTVWRDGAQAVWLEPGGVRILSDRDERGDRPWVPPSPSFQKPKSALPSAAVQTLPADP